MKNFTSITQFHQLLGLPDPLHPLFSVIEVSDFPELKYSDFWKRFSTAFYTVSLKKGVRISMKYGREDYDFDKGVMNFMAPNQIQSVKKTEVINLREDCGSGHILMFHPDFIYAHPLSKKLQDYGFFTYAINEALHLSAKEETEVIELFVKMKAECRHIDKHTQDIIVAYLELLLRYCNRFYERQFITRKKSNNDLLVKMEKLLKIYFEEENTLYRGIPTVDFLAENLHLSPRYLSDMLRSLTGLSARQHIQLKLIEKAKELLSTTNLSVSEIAFKLGFEYPQSFHKMFKKRTDMSPMEFRAGFN